LHEEPLNISVGLVNVGLVNAVLLGEAIEEEGLKGGVVGETNKHIIVS
jgi:hypothetical protein